MAASSSKITFHAFFYSFILLFLISNLTNIVHAGKKQAKNAADKLEIEENQLLDAEFEKFSLFDSKMENIEQENSQKDYQSIKKTSNISLNFDSKTTAKNNLPRNIEQAEKMWTKHFNEKTKQFQRLIHQIHDIKFVQNDTVTINPLKNTENSLKETIKLAFKAKSHYNYFFFIENVKKLQIKRKILSKYIDCHLSEDNIWKKFLGFLCKCSILSKWRCPGLPANFWSDFLSLLFYFRDHYRESVLKSTGPENEVNFHAAKSEEENFLQFKSILFTKIISDVFPFAVDGKGFCHPVASRIKNYKNIAGKYFSNQEFSCQIINLESESIFKLLKNIKKLLNDEFHEENISAKNIKKFTEKLGFNCSVNNAPDVTLPFVDFFDSDLIQNISSLSDLTDPVMCPRSKNLLEPLKYDELTSEQYKEYLIKQHLIYKNKSEFRSTINLINRDDNSLENLEKIVGSYKYIEKQEKSIVNDVIENIESFDNPTKICPDAQQAMSTFELLQKYLDITNNKHEEMLKNDGDESKLKNENSSPDLSNFFEDCGYNPYDDYVALCTWNKMHKKLLLNSDPVSIRSDFLEALWKFGIPHILRKFWWPIMTRASKSEIKFPETFTFVDTDKNMLNIMKADVNRSKTVFFNNIHLVAMTKKCCRATLAASDGEAIGFTQGMELIAKRLLFYLREVEAAKILNRLITHYELFYYLSIPHQQPNITERLLCRLFPQLLEPNIMPIMQALDIKEIVSLFDDFESKWCIRIYDLFFYYGPKIFPAVFCAFVQLHSNGNFCTFNAVYFFRF